MRFKGVGGETKEGVGEGKSSEKRGKSRVKAGIVSSVFWKIGVCRRNVDINRARGV